MSVEILDGATIHKFVEDETAFTNSINDRFTLLDSNYDGLLLYYEITQELTILRILETHFGIDDVRLSKKLTKLYQDIFTLFDHDGNGSVDVEEFEEEMKKVILVMENGLGFLPVQMVVEEGSFLKKAVERELNGKIDA